MSRTITITEPVWPYCGRKLDAILEGHGVTVMVSPNFPVFVPWDNVTNVEWLAEKFREVRVYELRAVCRVLHNASAMRDMVEIKPSVPDLDKAMQKQREWQEYLVRASERLAQMDALAPACAFDKLPGQRTAEEQAAWDEHERILREQIDDEQAQGL